MPAQRFDSLRERLLRAGVAPRHVRRYLHELGDHYEDALRAELAQGENLAQARQRAWARLGTEETLAQSILERPELRSSAARSPALYFGVGPVLGWVGAPFVIAGTLQLLPEALRHALPPADAARVFYALLLFYARLLPVLLGALALTAASDRRSKAGWPLAGAASVDVLAGTLAAHLVPGQLGISSSLLPWLVPVSAGLGPRDATALGAGLLRAACMLAFSLILWRLVQHLRRVKPLAPAAR